MPILAFSGDQIASFTEGWREWNEIRNVTQDLEPGISEKMYIMVRMSIHSNGNWVAVILA